MSKYTLGQKRKQDLKKDVANGKTYNDVEQRYAVGKHYVLSFFSLPTAQNVQFKAMISDFDDHYESNWNKEASTGEWIRSRPSRAPSEHYR